MGGGAVKGFYKDSSYPIKLQGQQPALSQEPDQDVRISTGDSV